MKMPAVPFLYSYQFDTDEPGGTDEFQKFGQRIVEMMDGWGKDRSSRPQVHCFRPRCNYDVMGIVLISPRYNTEKNIKAIEKWVTQELIKAEKGKERDIDG